MCVGLEEQFFIDDMPIKNVYRFKYLEGIVTFVTWLFHECWTNDSDTSCIVFIWSTSWTCTPIGRPKLRYKDTCESVLKSGKILDEWSRALVVDRQLWKRTIGMWYNVECKSNCILRTTKGDPSSKESYKWKLNWLI